MLHDSFDRSHELTAPTISFRIYLHFSHRTANDREVTNFATFGADSFPSWGKRLLVYAVAYEECKAQLADCFWGSCHLNNELVSALDLAFPSFDVPHPNAFHLTGLPLEVLRALADASSVSQFWEGDPISSIGFATVICEEFQKRFCPWCVHPFVFKIHNVQPSHKGFECALPRLSLLSESGDGNMLAHEWYFSLGRSDLRISR